MHVQLDGVSLHYGAATILSRVTLTVGARSRIGVVGPNGVGKSTLLRLIAGLDAPDEGRVVRAPETLTVGYLEQERTARAGETVGELLRRRTGVADAETELESAAAALATDPAAADRYDRSLARFVALGGGDLDVRAAGVLADLGLSVALHRESGTLSGGESARLALASILLTRVDMLLLDEPTNDLDFDGLERLERFVDGYRGALVAVSHDRAFLDRAASRIVAIDPSSRTVTEWAGGWSAYAEARDTARRAAYARFEVATQRRRELTELLSRRRTEARSQGAGLGERSGGADRRGTHALMTKVRQAERLLERNDLPEKPFEPWELHLALRAGTRPGGLVARLSGAVVERGEFRLGPVDLDLVSGERLAITGPNGSGKSTLLAALLGDLPLTSGTRELGRAIVPGVIGQERSAAGEASLLDDVVARTGVPSVDARTLLAKFGLGADHVLRPASSLSPGERTRALLAELQQRGVNLLVLDEPTNHLDLEAVEQLEQALGAYDGTLVLVSHDRRFLEAVVPTRSLRLPL